MGREGQEERGRGGEVDFDAWMEWGHQLAKGKTGAVLCYSYDSVQLSHKKLKLTVTAQYWPGSLCHSLIDSSQCSTPPLVSCFRQDGQNM